MLCRLCELIYEETVQTMMILTMMTLEITIHSIEDTYKQVSDPDPPS